MIAFRRHILLQCGHCCRTGNTWQVCATRSRACCPRPKCYTPGLLHVDYVGKAVKGRWLPEWGKVAVPLGQNHRSRPPERARIPDPHCQARRGAAAPQSTMAWFQALRCSFTLMCVLGVADIQLPIPHSSLTATAASCQCPVLLAARGLAAAAHHRVTH